MTAYSGQSYPLQKSGCVTSSSELIRSTFSNQLGAAEIATANNRIPATLLMLWFDVVIELCIVKYSAVPHLYRNLLGIMHCDWSVQGIVS